MNSLRKLSIKFENIWYDGFMRTMTIKITAIHEIGVKRGLGKQLTVFLLYYSVIQ